MLLDDPKKDVTNKQISMGYVEVEAQRNTYRFFTVQTIQ